MATQAAEWSSASDVCHGLHSQAHLVVINSAPKQSAVEDFITGDDRTSYRARAVKLENIYLHELEMKDSQ